MELDINGMLDKLKDTVGGEELPDEKNSASANEHKFTGNTAFPGYNGEADITAGEDGVTVSALFDQAETLYSGTELIKKEGYAVRR